MTKTAKAGDTGTSPDAGQSTAALSDGSKSKPAVDWERIEVEYRAGVLSVREIARRSLITEAGIRQRAKRDGWKRDLIEVTRSEKVVLEEDELDKAGFVYVIYIDDSGSKRYYKIGMSGTFSARFQNHQCASPFDICVACAYFVGNMRAEERLLHSRFKKNNIRGEWFDLSAGDLREIAERALLV